MKSVEEKVENLNIYVCVLLIGWGEKMIIIKCYK